MASGQPYALHVVFTLRSEEAARAFDQLVTETLVGISTEPGTLVYTVHVPDAQPLVRVFYELYASEDAFRDHEDQVHTKLMLADRTQFLAQPPQVTFMHQSMGKLPSTA
ncbi:putative quinol monooxygenase [Streptomyces sp. NPDC001205]